MMNHTKTLQWIYQNIQMEAIVSYSSKDYTFKLIVPFMQEFDGTHMLHMAPVMYDLLEGEDQDKKNVMRNKICVLDLSPIVIDRCNQWVNEKMFSNL